MPKRIKEEEKRVALNCLVSPATRNAITQIVGETKESQGEIVDRAVALLAFGEEIERAPKAVADHVERESCNSRTGRSHSRVRELRTCGSVG